MNIGLRLAAGRFQERENKDKADDARRKNLMGNEVAQLKARIKDLLNKFQELREEKNKHEDIMMKIGHPILKDLYFHSMEPNSEYSEQTFDIAMRIHAASPKAYSILAEELFFPSTNAVQYRFAKSISQFPDLLVNIENVNEIVSLYKENSALSKSESIDACLSVDAIYFTPDVTLTDEAVFTGIDTKGPQALLIPPDVFKILSADIKSFDHFLQLQYENIIKAGFVFQIQPYDPRYQSFVVHILPSSSGKSNERVVDLLHEIRNTVKRRNINIKSFAFDGDSAYRGIHVMYYESYIHRAIKTQRINLKYSKELRIVSDYLHIIKRLRYRLLRGVVHAGFHQNEASGIVLSDLQCVLDDLLAVIWDNNKYTKMVDRLPMELFRVENLLRLLDAKMFNAAGYFFPISLSLLAINTKDLGFSYRYFLLQIALWFLIIYRELWNNDPGTLKQRIYSTDANIMYYTEDLLMEFSNTLHCHLQFMGNINNYSFARNSTQPLEHKFGFARRRARDIHTFQRFLRTISSLQAIEQEQIMSDFSHAKSQCEALESRGSTGSFGVIVEQKNEDEDIHSVFNEDCEIMFEGDYVYTPQQIAKTMLSLASFQVDVNPCFTNVEEIYGWMYNFLFQLCDDVAKKRKKSKIKSTSTKLGTGQCTRGRFLITGTIPMREHKISKKEQKHHLLLQIIQEKIGIPPQKQHFKFIIEKICDVDQSIRLSHIGKSKKKMIEWLVDHLSSYFLFIQALDMSHYDE